MGFGTARRQAVPRVPLRHGEGYELLPVWRALRELKEQGLQGG